MKNPTFFTKMHSVKCSPFLFKLQGINYTTTIYTNGSRISVIIVPADVLEPTSDRPSTGTVMATKLHVAVQFLVWLSLLVILHFLFTLKMKYRQISNIRRTLIGNKLVDHSDVGGASPIGAAPSTSSFST